MMNWISQPTFIVIGPGRTGSTMLYMAIKEHPQICTARNIKETNFFTDNYEKGFDWYKSFFDHCDNHVAIGEVSNTYIYDTQVPSRIHSFLPDVKLISVLRNPYDRLISAFSFRKRMGELDSSLNIFDALQKHPDLISQNFYSDQLKCYLQYFRSEQVLIALYDDLKTAPSQFISMIFSFIGVDSDFKTEAMKNRVNPSAAVRFQFLSRVIRKGADFLRRKEKYSTLGYLKSSVWFRNMLFKSDSGISDNDRKELIEILRPEFQPHIEWVELKTGRDLSHWYY